MLHLCKRPVHVPKTEMIEREKSQTPSRIGTHEYFFKACPDRNREANLEHYGFVYISSQCSASDHSATAPPYVRPLDHYACGYTKQTLNS